MRYFVVWFSYLFRKKNFYNDLIRIWRTPLSSRVQPASHMIHLLCLSFVPSCDRRTALAAAINMREVQHMKDELAATMAKDETRKRRLEDNIVATVELFPDVGRRNRQFSVDEGRLADVGARRRDDEWKWNVLSDLEYAMGECAAADGE